MTLSSLSEKQTCTALGGSGLTFRAGAFSVRLKSDLQEVIEGVRLLYADHPFAVESDFADFHVSVERPGTLRRWYRPQALFRFDGQTPFKPLPRDQALPLLEWGLNWCIANHSHCYLVIHAAAIERNGKAAILPGPPGSGKSTLCAGLVSRGWRLLSDELTLVDMVTGNLVPLARPISLKNESIGLIRKFCKGATLSREAVDTNKGTVALLRPPTASVARASEPAKPAWVIVPQYERGARIWLQRRSKAETFMELAENSFNYSIHGTAGFECLSHLIDLCDCYAFAYSDLDEAVAAFATLRAPA